MGTCSHVAHSIRWNYEDYEVENRQVGWTVWDENMMWYELMGQSFLFRASQHNHVKSNG